MRMKSDRTDVLEIENNTGNLSHHLPNGNEGLTVRVLRIVITNSLIKSLL